MSDDSDDFDLRALVERRVDELAAQNEQRAKLDQQRASMAAVARERALAVDAELAEQRRTDRAGIHRLLVEAVELLSERQVRPHAVFVRSDGPAQRDHRGIDGWAYTVEQSERYVSTGLKGLDLARVVSYSGLAVCADASVKRWTCEIDIRSSRVARRLPGEPVDLIDFVGDRLAHMDRLTVVRQNLAAWLPRVIVG